MSFYCVVCSFCFKIALAVVNTYSISWFAALIGTMPVGGVQSQNPTQGLVHWMSAVMAEHMTSNSHHDPTVGMHYMWNGGVDVSIHPALIFTWKSLFFFSICLCFCLRVCEGEWVQKSQIRKENRIKTEWDIYEQSRIEWVKWCISRKLLSNIECLTLHFRWI